MSWNYRIIDHRTHFALHEVFYNEAGEVRAWSAEPAGFVSCWIEGAGGWRKRLTARCTALVTCRCWRWPTCPAGRCACRPGS